MRRAGWARNVSTGGKQRTHGRSANGRAAGTLTGGRRGEGIAHGERGSNGPPVEKYLRHAPPGVNASQAVSRICGTRTRPRSASSLGLEPCGRHSRHGVSRPAGPKESARPTGLNCRIASQLSLISGRPPTSLKGGSKLVFYMEQLVEDALIRSGSVLDPGFDCIASASGGISLRSQCPAAGDFQNQAV